MSLQVSDLNLPADKLVQIATALGDTGSTNAVLQTYCDAAAADVARLSAGYILDDDSTTNMGRAIALYKVYAQIGPVPPDIEKSYEDYWKELQSIARGERPNLPKQSNAAMQSRAGSAGSSHRIHGRMRRGEHLY
jgi:hypothetical protein